MTYQGGGSQRQPPLFFCVKVRVFSYYIEFWIVIPPVVIPADPPAGGGNPSVNSVCSVFSLINLIHPV